MVLETASHLRIRHRTQEDRRDVRDDLGIRVSGGLRQLAPLGIAAERPPALFAGRHVLVHQHVDRPGIPGPAIVREKNTRGRPARLKMSISPTSANIFTFARCARSLWLS